MTKAQRVPIPRRGVDYRNKIVLAPMVRSGECPSRLLALHYGADLVWGPETVDKALIGCTRRENPATGTVDFTRFSNNGQKNHVPTAEQQESVIYRLHPELEGKKLIYQIGTADPDLAVQAASLIAPDVAGIDVNAGCPKPFSTLGGMGAALLKTPDLLCNILTALVEKVGRPHEIGISVKIRILDTPDKTRALVERLVRTGITGLTVHCRTTPMRPRERAIRDQVKMIVGICHDAGVACLMNGDVAGHDHARELMAEYGADGCMIAVAAEANPSCFSAGPLAEWHDVVAEYLAYALKVDNRWGNTKYLLGQMIPGRAPVYNGMKTAKCYGQLVALLGLEERLGEKAKEVDARLGLGAETYLTKAEKKAKNKAQGKKRSAEEAELTNDTSREQAVAPGTIREEASVLVV